MSLVQFCSIAFFGPAFTFASYIPIGNLLMERNDEYRWLQSLSARQASH
jgi:hypothetical protein